MDDPILEVLYKETISYKDIDELCNGFDEDEESNGQIEDIRVVSRILNGLNEHLLETKSWSFEVLDNYNFSDCVIPRGFDVKVAKFVGSRCQEVLKQINSWGISKLKTKVAQLVPSGYIYTKSSSTVLTILVLRVLKSFAALEFRLQLAIARSTLIKIHGELCGLVDGEEDEQEEENDDYDNSTLDTKQKHGRPLVDAYRTFVAQLLSELESTPYETVQRELFQIIDDLQGMFTKFAAAKYARQEYTDSASEASFPPYSPVPPASPYPPPHSEFYKGPHRRTFSSSTGFSSLSTRSSITDELPIMMYAFEVARHQEEELKLAKRSYLLPLNPSSNKQLQAQPLVPFALAHQQKKLTLHDPKPLHKPSGPRPRPSPPPPITLPQSDRETLQVKMISKRMMVKVGSTFVDMQDWLNQANATVAPPAARSASPAAATTATTTTTTTSMTTANGSGQFVKPSSTTPLAQLPLYSNGKRSPPSRTGSLKPKSKPKPKPLPGNSNNSFLSRMLGFGEKNYVNAMEF